MVNSPKRPSSTPLTTSNTTSAPSANTMPTFAPRFILLYLMGVLTSVNLKLAVGAGAATV